MSHNHRDVHRAGIHKVGGFAGGFVRILGEISAVVAEENDECVFPQTEPVDGIHQFSEPRIDEGD